MKLLRTRNLGTVGYVYQLTLSLPSVKLKLAGASAKLAMQLNVYINKQIQKQINIHITVVLSTFLYCACTIKRKLRELFFFILVHKMQRM